MRVVFGPLFVVMIASQGLVGCKSKSETPAAPAPATVTPSASVSAVLPPPKRRNWQMPSGPALAVIPGQGLGPIRIGANLATIERLMALPCDVKTEEMCRYIGRGVDFHFVGGVTERIHVQRAGRPAGKDASGEEREFGFFNGVILPDLRLGMIPAAIQEHLGKPQKLEVRVPSGVANNAELHEYDGMHLEYDRIENGNLILAGIWLYKSATAIPEPSARKPAAPVQGK